jgi:phosphinothricin acetyltransferase
VDVIVRPGAEADIAALNDLYNHYVRTSPATFDLEPITMAARGEWFAKYGETGRYRLLVAHDARGPVGYATSSPFRPKAAYETSVETTVYVAHDSVGTGVGRRLYEALFAALQGEDVHRAYAGITMPNDASVVLHERFGFRRVAYFTEQGRKFGQYWDVAWLEKPLA